MSITDQQVKNLKNNFSGNVISPDMAEYQSARHVHNLLADKYPFLIIQPLNADDVVQAVSFASQMQLPIAVRSGGHSLAGFGTLDDGIVIDFTLMRDITIDQQRQTARAQSGVTAGEYTNATLQYDLVTPFGDSPSVGVGGITLGGGIGWLSRKLGMTIDSLLAVEIVTSDGRKLHASETEHPDLFWAIRGGGGNFGIITSFEFKLHPINTILGGSLFLPPTREVLRGLINLAEQAPDELTMITLFMYAPSVPEIPREIHGQLCLIVDFVWAGELSAGEEAIAPFRKLTTPLADHIHPMPYSEMYEIMAPAGEPVTSISRAFFADTFDDTAIDAMINAMQKTQLPTTSSIVSMQLRVLGGAIKRIPSDATAFSHRDANLFIGKASLGFDPANEDEHRTWVKSAFEATNHCSTGAYINFLEDEDDNRVRSAYSAETYRKLMKIKQKYDPNNGFHHNNNILPALFLS